MPLIFHGALFSEKPEKLAPVNYFSSSYLPSRHVGQDQLAPG